MHAELRGIYSPDVPEMDPATYSPDDPECFSLNIGAFIGPNEPPLGEELFEFNVCTAKWLASNPPGRDCPEAQPIRALGVRRVSGVKPVCWASVGADAWWWVGGGRVVPGAW